MFGVPGATVTGANGEGIMFKQNKFFRTTHIMGFVICWIKGHVWWVRMDMSKTPATYIDRVCERCGRQELP